MATELIYTSAPAGLKPGTYGFCVVACTRGLKESYATALQSLSGYRRLFSPESGRERQNPVVYANYVVEIGGVPTRVLSRVGDAGYDYSNRTNKIAHHLILSNSELASAGPAALFAVPNLFVERWNSKPTYIEQEKKIPTPTEAPLRGSYWKELTGDSEWARALAATVSTDRSVLLIVRPDCDVLRLYREALELLPPRQRWNATFSTYFTSVPPGVRCQWKAVITGSPEEEQLRARRDTLVVDLTDPRKTGELAKFVANLPNWRLEKQATPQPERNAVQIETRVSAPRPTDPATPQVSDRPKVYSLRAEDVLTTGVPIKPKPIRKKLNYGRDAVLTTDVPVKKNNNVVAILASIGILSLFLVVFGAVFLFTCTHSKDANPQNGSSVGNSEEPKETDQETENSDSEKGTTSVDDNDGSSVVNSEEPKENDQETENSDSKKETTSVDDNDGNNADDSEEPKETDQETENSDSKEETPDVDNKNENNVDDSEKQKKTPQDTEAANLIEEDAEEKIIDAFNKFAEDWKSEDSNVIQKISFSTSGKDAKEIEEGITGTYQGNLKNLVKICQENKHTLDLKVRLLDKQHYIDDPNSRECSRNFDFNQEAAQEITFDIHRTKNKGENNSITFKINDEGSLSIIFSDQKIRDYFLLYGQIQWSVNTDTGPMQSPYIALLEAEKSYFPPFKQDDKTLSFDIDLKKTYEKTEISKLEWKFLNQIRNKKDSKVYLIVELESKQQKDLEEKNKELGSKQQEVLKEKNGKYQYAINNSKIEFSLDDKDEDEGKCVINFTPPNSSSIDHIKNHIVEDLTIKVCLGDKDGRTLLKVIKDKQPEDKQPEEPGANPNSNQASQNDVK